MKKIVLLFGLLFMFFGMSNAQHSVARDWNEELLNAIRNDFARPTVHARNLFHSSVAMYDAWAIFDDTAETVFLGKTFGGYTFNFNGITTPTDVDAARHEIISYAMFRLISHRFTAAPSSSDIMTSIETLFTNYGYDTNFTSVDYNTGSYAALGNYIAQEIIAFGLTDGSNETNDYENFYYNPVNSPLILELYEDNLLEDPNRWQPLAFDVFIDQSGNPFPLNTPEFLSPEWGQVVPFSLKDSDLQIFNNGFDSYVYKDPGPPTYIQNSSADGIDDPYKWNMALVIAWSAHLDPADNVMVDISPGALGNIDISEFPETFDEYKAFYNFTDGGDLGTGHALNPFTNAPYTPQMVKRADYARVLAEFWADGPDSETPPGHWFTIMNYVSDHPETVKQFNGQGPILNNLEWDVKSYLALGGAMHDSAVTTWGIKGYYDFIRPISAIRYMALKGQSTDPNLASFDPHGLPLIENLIELIETGDPLSGDNDENVGKVKVRAWKGPDFINDPTTDVAGVDWILGSHWWPYQRATFVTPPFAGYLSGHSTFSRAASETLTLITGDKFFPGGMGTFDADQNDFLVFEQGPSEGFVLQWATYQDASDQTSLSRIWGGIHPPIDDIRGRIIGEQIGQDAFDKAEAYFSGDILNIDEDYIQNETMVYPIPTRDKLNIRTPYLEIINIEIISITGAIVYKQSFNNQNGQFIIDTSVLTDGVYILKGRTKNNHIVFQKKIIK